MRFFRLLSLGLVFGVIACSLPAPVTLETHYRQPGTPGGRLCTNQCKNAANHCEEACTYKERLCIYDVQAQAIKDYEVYVQEQFEQRMAVDLRPSDFEHTEQCIQGSCKQDCKKAYEICFQKCGGEIELRPVR